MKDVKSVYQQIIANSEKELLQVRRKIYFISLLRLLLFVGIGVNLYLFGSDGWLKCLLWVGIPILAFLWLVKRHNLWFYRKDELKKRIEINEQELKGLAYDFSAFDSGEAYMDAEHPYTFDLDVFGQRSLFQAVNRTSTPVGRHCLASWFQTHLTDKESIETRQEAVQELTPEVAYRQQLRLLGLLYKGQPTDRNDWKNWAESPHFYRDKWYIRLFPLGVGMVNLLSFTLVMLGVLSWNVASTVLVGFMLCSTVFTNGITRFQDRYGKKLQMLSMYANQIALIEKKELKAKALVNLQKRLVCHGRTASQVMGDLSQMMNTLDQRNNMLVSMLLNGLLGWELIQVMRMERWKEQYGTFLSQWVDVVGEMEAYCSLAAWAFNHPVYTYPKIGVEPFQLRAVAMGHPLMEADRCVRNNLDIGQKPFFVIITGANMAGKSTYLRTIGVNYLLACMGAPVWAEEMEVYPAQLITSLRTTDSLADHESYFFAELKRLKRIIDLLKEGKELFIILDEILKGTNSMDKQKGSLALVKQFIEMQATGIIATHDLLLGSLKDSFPAYIQNYCFEADIIHDELTFSYRMREGIAQNMNACFLMKKMGIVGLEN